MFKKKESDNVGVSIKDYNTNNSVCMVKKSFLSFNQLIKFFDYAVLELIIKMELLKILLKTFCTKLVL